jgi:hypothetical protein
MKDQHVKGLLACWVMWLKLIQTLAPAQTLVLDTAPIFDEHGQAAICHSSEDHPASSQRQQYKRRC